MYRAVIAYAFNSRSDIYLPESAMSHIGIRTEVTPCIRTIKDYLAYMGTIDLLDLFHYTVQLTPRIIFGIISPPPLIYADHFYTPILLLKFYYKSSFTSFLNQYFPCINFTTFFDEFCSPLQINPSCPFVLIYRLLCFYMVLFHLIYSIYSIQINIKILGEKSIPLRFSGRIP